MRNSAKIRNHGEMPTIKSRKRHSLLSATTIAALTIFSNHHLEVVDSLSMKPSKSSTSRASPSRQRSRRDDDTTKPPNTPPPKHKIEFVNFWGSKIITDDSDNTDAIDPRNIPYVETLDLHDGPLPPGAYLQEGKPEFEAKSTCRIGLNLKISNNRKGHQIDADEMVRRLQNCIDAGFQTFQLQHQTRQGMELMAKLRQETPAYVETHLSLRHQIPTFFGSGSPHQQQLETRHSVLKLIAQTGDTALDSLQLVYNPNSPYTLDVLDHLAELQRDGYIRSIGVKDMPRNLLKQARNAGLAVILDFQHQSGNLLLPTDDCDDNLNVWMDNVLVGSLLTGSRKEPLQMTREEEAVLHEWATRREAINLDVDDEPTSFKTMRLFNMYQDEVAETLQWIALKHRVTPTAVAIRWALECGSDGVVEDHDDDDTTGLPPIVSSALIDCDLSVENFDGVPTEWRKVFRFQLDEEDKAILQECSAPSLEQVERAEKLRQAKSTSTTEDHGANPEDALNDWERELLEYQRAMEESDESFEDDEYPEIDFSNQALWL